MALMKDYGGQSPWRCWIPRSRFGTMTIRPLTRDEVVERLQRAAARVIEPDLSR